MLLFKIYANSTDDCLRMLNVDFRGVIEHPLLLLPKGERKFRCMIMCCQQFQRGRLLSKVQQHSCHCCQHIHWISSKLLYRCLNRLDKWWSSKHAYFDDKKRLVELDQILKLFGM